MGGPAVVDDREDGRRRDRPGRRLLRRLLVGLVVLVALLALLVVVLRVTNPAPRDAEGWRATAPLPEPRGESSGTVVATAEGPRLAVAGGLAGLGDTRADVTLYDPDAGTWSHAPPLPEPRHHAAAAGLDGSLYVSGGAPSTRELRTPTAPLWVLDLDAHDARWETLEPMLAPRWAHRMVALDGRLFVVGGQPGAEVQIYEPGAGWRLGAAIPEVRDHLGVVVLDGEIWALGGRDRDEVLSARVDVYDPDADEWREGPELPTPVSAAAVGVIDGRIHVVDGEDPAPIGGGVLDAQWVLDGDDWQPGPPSRLPVHGAADGVIDGRLYVAGGASRQGAWSAVSWTDEVQVFDPADAG